MSNRHDKPEHEGRFSEGEERLGEDAVATCEETLEPVRG
jgi:hypothetical protein